MSENVDHLILEHLKAIRAEVAAVKNDTSEIKSRLRDVENGFIDTKRGELHLHEVDARQQVSRSAWTASWNGLSAWSGAWN